LIDNSLEEFLLVDRRGSVLRFLNDLSDGMLSKLLWLVCVVIFIGEVLCGVSLCGEVLLRSTMRVC
jgi:hypothetical protein